MRIIFAFCLALASIKGMAQITLEHSYPTNNHMSVVYIVDDGYKYIGVDTASKNIKIYNLDHSLWKTIPTNMPSTTPYQGNLFLASKYLFDNDPMIEVVVSFVNPLGVGASKIIKEDGTLLLYLPNIYSCYLSNVGNSWKLLAHSGQDVNHRFHTDIYSLPGTYTGILKPAPGSTNISINPNPFSSTARLNYTLPTGISTATIDIYNISGVKVRSYQVTNQYDDLLISRDDLPSGVYIYKVITANSAPVANQFIIE